PPSSPPPNDSFCYDVQASIHFSPVLGQNVRVPGVVTAVASNGFYLQDPNPDANPATSEGIFVFTSSRPTVVIGNQLSVVGKVSEFRPGGAETNLTTTDLTSPVITKTAASTPV